MRKNVIIISDEANHSECNYDCQSSGGCSVQYIGPPRGGPAVGSCFPALFGGTCNGTPPECLECNKVLDCEADSEDKEDDSDSETSPNKSKDVCDYQCQDSGGCQVLYTGWCASLRFTFIFDIEDEMNPRPTKRRQHSGLMFPIIIWGNMQWYTC